MVCPALSPQRSRSCQRQCQHMPCVAACTHTHITLTTTYTPLTFLVLLMLIQRTHTFLVWFMLTATCMPKRTSLILKRSQNAFHWHDPDCWHHLHHIVHFLFNTQTCLSDISIAYTTPSHQYLALQHTWQTKLGARRVNVCPRRPPTRNHYWNR